MSQYTETVPLLSNGSATGTGYKVRSGGRYVFSVYGTFSGATINLQWSLDNSTWTTVTSGSFTAAGSVSVDIGTGTYARVSITGGPPSGIFATLIKAPQ
jgi:hypothetical protein